MSKKSILTNRDHVNMDAFLGYVFDDYKDGIITKEQAVSGLAHVMSALDNGEESEVRTWLEQGRKLVRYNSENNSDKNPRPDLARLEAVVLETIIDRLKSCTDSVGASAPSEDDLIAEGVRFGDWEKGFNAAIEIIDRRMKSAVFIDPLGDMPESMVKLIKDLREK